MSKEKRQVVRYVFYKLDAAWRRLEAAEQIEHKEQFAHAVKSFHAKLLLRTYSLAGTRGDSDFLLWQATEDVETLQHIQTALFSTRLGGYLTIPYSYLAMTKRSLYKFPDHKGKHDQLVTRPADNRYFFVYPFIKKREWYSASLERRQEMMNEHVRIGRKYPSIRLNTTYSFGLDDQEFIVAFEGDDPGEFLDLVMELRESEASSYTLKDTPTFTCVQMSLYEVLDSLGGAALPKPAAADAGRGNGLYPVADVDDVPPGSSKRIYLGSDAIALFNVGGRFYAVSDRCTHGRASLSEGVVDGDGLVLTCPWHQGKFELASGKPLGGPPVTPIKTYRVEVEGGRILVG